MAKKYYLAVLLLSVLLTFPNDQLMAQDDGQRKIPIQLAAISDMDVSLNPGSPISFSPGLMLDVGLRLMNKEKLKANGNKSREIYLKPFLGFYKRADYHTALMIGSDITYRATSPSGFFWDLNAGTGYMRLFYNTPVYEYIDGSFEKKRMVGYSNVVIKGNINFGFDFSQSGSGLPFGIYAGGGMFFRYPNNHSWAYHPYVQLGVMYTLKKNKK